MIKKTIAGDMMFMDKNGAATFLFGNAVDRVIFSDKAVNVDAIPNTALVNPSDLPALDNGKELKLEIEASQLQFALHRGTIPLPTSAIVDLVFSRMFHQELSAVEAQQWKKVVHDYTQQPEQEAYLIGLIRENEAVLLA